MDSTAIVVEGRHRIIALSEERKNAEERGNEERVRQLTLEICLFSVSIEKELRHLRSQLPEVPGEGG